jgi:Asp-tRNA(Asn)/Glu-tRNA(Gln) amidotransferase A subunit family amidase
MKKLFFILPILLLVLGFTAQRILDDKLKNLLQQFKTDEATAKTNLFYAVSGPQFYIPNVKIVRDMAVGDRVSLIQSIGNNVKEYIATKDFVKKYNQLREDRKPTPPEEPKYSAQLKEEARANLKNGIAETEKTKTQMAKEQQAMFDEIIKSYKQQLIDIDDPEKTMYKPEMDEYIKQGYQMQMDEYKNKLAEWEVEYPIDNPNPMIKKWINTFLDKSADINFDAKLEKDKYGKMKFVDQQYEYKDSQWKLYFRAGKETVTAARTFAQGWLGEIK